MANGRSSNTYDNEAGRNFFLNNCLRINMKDNDYKELNDYLVRDNINNMLIVSIILMLVSVVKCVCRMNHIWYADSGLGLFFISLIYVFLWCFIKNELIEGIKAQKYVYLTFWILINLMELKYLYMELQKYNTILTYMMMMFLLIGFYVDSFQFTLFFIIFNSFIAIEMVVKNSPIGTDSRLYISIIETIAVISIIIMVIKYHNYMKDKRARIAIRTVGEVDRLTNLLNRRGFEEKLAELWPLLHDTRKTIMAIMIDIDNFKSYNDTYGHIAGDQCLKDVTECIYDVASRKTGLVVRYGGEEIVVVLTDVSEVECLEVAQNIQERVNALNIKSGTGATHTYVTVSMGISSMTVNNSNTIYDLIYKADEQLYYSKNSGRNRITMNNILVELNKIRVMSPDIKSQGNNK